MLTPLSNDEKIIISQNDQLRRYLESLLSDKETTERSWLYDGLYGNKYKDPDQILTDWLERLKSLETGDDYQRNVYQFDISQREKWGPQGGHAPLQKVIKEVVLPTFEGGEVKPEAFGTPEWQVAKRNVIRELHIHGVNRLRPAAYERVIDDMRARDTLESNSGWPDFKRRNIPEVKDRALADARSGKWKSYPAILLFRYYNQKLRPVWMYPMSANIVEGSFTQVVQSAIMRSGLADLFFSPWKGFDAVQRLVSTTYSTKASIGASDFTSTDAHFQLATSKEAYDVLKECFLPQYSDALWESISRMHEIPLIVSPTQKVVGEHGVASGSNWTNFIETIFDMILAEYVSIITSGAVKGLYAIGDDMAWVARSGFRETFRNELEDIGKSVGQIIKADKTMLEPHKVKSLQRLFQRGYFTQEGTEVRAVYSTVRALKSSVYPERFHDTAKGWNSDMFCARQFMILENCVDHPLFEEFVRYVCDGNHHLVPFAKLSSADLDRIHREAKLIPGLNPTYNQEKRDSSLSQFASIRYASKL